MRLYEQYLTVVVFHLVVVSI